MDNTGWRLRRDLKHVKLKITSTQTQTQGVVRRSFPLAKFNRLRTLTWLALVLSMTSPQAGAALSIDARIRLSGRTRINASFTHGEGKATAAHHHPSYVPGCWTRASSQPATLDLRPSISVTYRKRPCLPASSSTHSFSTSSFVERHLCFSCG